jgi:integrase
MVKHYRTKRRFRKQTGHIVERSNAFFVRFYRYAADGSKVKVTEKLCDRSADHYSADCHAVKVLCDLHMARVNAERHKQMAVAVPLPPAPGLTIGGFWQATYMPWMEANLRNSTQRCYKYLWSLYLRDELETKTLADFSTIDAVEILERFASMTLKDGTTKGLGENTLAQIRSLMSGIFTRAANTKGPNGKGLITHNPIRESDPAVKVRRAKPRNKYTLKEIVAVLKALSEPDAKLFFAFCSVLAMRPSEVAGLQWENIDITGGSLKVLECAPYGHYDPNQLKTDNSRRDLVFSDDLRSFIRAWHEKAGKPSTGFVFPTVMLGVKCEHSAYSPAPYLRAFRDRAPFRPFPE